MFLLSRRFGALADRYGPRLFMGVGPLVAACGILLLLRTGLHTSFLGDLLPALVVFGIGLSMTVAPLTATVLADADDSDAGIASAINNAIARIAGLVGVSVMGVVVSSTLVGDSFAPNSDSVHAFHMVIACCAALVAAGGVVGALGIVNPSKSSRRSPVRAASSSATRRRSVDCGDRPAVPVGTTDGASRLIASARLDRSRHAVSPAPYTHDRCPESC